MPQIREIKIRSVEVPRIPSWQEIAAPNLPQQPRVTELIGFPVAHIPGCVETRQDQASNKDAYSNDPRGNYTVCDGSIPSYNPINYTPNNLKPLPAQPPTQTPPEKKPATRGKEPALSPSLQVPEQDLDAVLPIETPCPPLDAIPLGAKNKLQTGVIVGYKKINGICEEIVEPLPLPKVVGNYLPGAPAVMATATITAIAATTAVMAKPLGDILLRIVKPTVKTVMKKILKKKAEKPVSLSERILAQRDRNRAILALRRSLRP